MKPRNTNTGHADGFLSFVLIFGFSSSCAAANASLKANEEGSKFDIRSQYIILYGYENVNKRIKIEVKMYTTLYRMNVFFMTKQ